MEATLSHLRKLGAAFLDAWVVVDGERKVQEFNPHYRAFFPRHQARRLKGSGCCQFLQLGVCGNGSTCLARRCIDEGAAVRFDEIPANLEGDERPRKVIASAAPLG